MSDFMEVDRPDTSQPRCVRTALTVAILEASTRGRAVLVRNPQHPAAYYTRFRRLAPQMRLRTKQVPDGLLLWLEPRNDEPPTAGGAA